MSIFNARRALYGFRSGFNVISCQHLRISLKLMRKFSFSTPFGKTQNAVLTPHPIENLLNDSHFIGSLFGAHCPLGQRTPDIPHLLSSVDVNAASDAI